MWGTAPCPGSRGTTGRLQDLTTQVYRCTMGCFDSLDSGQSPLRIDSPIRRPRTAHHLVIVSPSVVRRIRRRNLELLDRVVPAIAGPPRLSRGGLHDGRRSQAVVGPWADALVIRLS